MRFDKYIQTDQLKPYIKYFVVSESKVESEYKVLPSAGLVIGFQYNGQLATLKDDKENKLSSAGITGIADTYKIFKNSENTGTVLVYFTETGFTHFASHPANELFNNSISLEEIFDKKDVSEIGDKLATTITDTQRIKMVEHFLLSQLKTIQTDKLIVEAVKLIYQSKGTIRVKAIAAGDVWKHDAQVGLGRRKFAGIATENAADGHHQNFISRVRAGHPTISRTRPARTEAIHRSQIIGDLGARKGGVEKHGGIIQRLGSADFPMEPIIIFDCGRGIGIGIHPIQTIRHGGGQAGIVLQRISRHGPSRGHGLQSLIGGYQIGGYRAQWQIVP